MVRATRKMRSCARAEKPKRSTTISRIREDSGSTWQHFLSSEGLISALQLVLVLANLFCCSTRAAMTRVRTSVEFSEGLVLANSR